MSDEKAIRQLIDTWISATKAGDFETVLNLMTDDVVYMVPGQEPFGKEAFRQPPPAGMRFEGESRVEEIKIFGDWAYARTYLKVTMTPPGGAPVHRSGYTLGIYRKEADGQWRLARDANMVMLDK